MSNEVCFLEEIAISNMYGTEAEKKRVGILVTHLIEEPEAIEKIVELAVLIEEIKRREITHMDWNCCYCSDCDRFYNCRIKWYRGEKNMTQYCCSYCQKFDRCLAKFQKQEKGRRIIEEMFIINIHGTDSELAASQKLYLDSSNLESFIKLAVMAEEIRTRELTKLKWNCCPRCTRYSSCRIRWERGETGCEQTCCSYCQNHKTCVSEFHSQEREKRLLESIFIINIHGTDEEASNLAEVLKEIQQPQNIIRLAALSEKIRLRELSGMDWFCCYECDKLTTCKINWERGPNNIPRNCCSYCKKYSECLSKFKKERP